jgi:hypothetical protein
MNFDDDILHYQILYQTWNQSGGHLSARRSFVLTNSEAFLFNETYMGDLSSCSNEGMLSNASYGDVCLRTIASAYVKNIASVCVSKDDAMMVIVVFDTKSKFSRSSTAWHLKCLTLENAERLIDDVRNAASL